MINLGDKVQKSPFGTLDAKMAKTLIIQFNKRKRINKIFFSENSQISISNELTNKYSDILDKINKNQIWKIILKTSIMGSLNLVSNTTVEILLNSQIVAHITHFDIFTYQELGNELIELRP